MNQPKLIEVPQDSPTRKQRLDAFKLNHGIETHKANGVEWMAVHMPSARELGADYGVTAEMGLEEIAAKICRLLDESHIASYGETEREAIQNLCDVVNITFQP